MSALAWLCLVSQTFLFVFWLNVRRFLSNQITRMTHPRMIAQICSVVLVVSSSYCVILLCLMSVPLTKSIHRSSPPASTKIGYNGGEMTKGRVVRTTMRGWQNVGVPTPRIELGTSRTSVLRS